MVASAAYPAEPAEPSDGVGRTGDFTFAPGEGATDVVGYRFALDDPNVATEATQVNASAPGQPVTVRVTPTHDWLNTLYVYPVDSTGGVGARAEYVFLVRPGADPVGHWELDEGAGTTAADSSGNGRSATLTGGASWSDGRVGKSLRLDGVSGTATTSGPVVQTDRSFSVSAWVRLTETGVTSTALSQDGSVNSGFTLGYVEGANRWAFGIPQIDADGAVSEQAVSEQPPQIGAWTHLLGTYDSASKRIRLYVNGRPDGTAGRTTAWASTGGLQIGRGESAGGYGAYWPGDVDDVKVWDRVVVDDPRGNEAAVLANRPPAQESWWRFDEGTGTAAADASGNNRTATLSTGAGWATDGHDGTAVHLNGKRQSASTSMTVLRTDQSFTVSAWVRLGGSGATAPPDHSVSALSQSGIINSGFYLGYRRFADGGKWSFTMAGADTAGSTWTHATSDPFHEPVPGQWTHVVGVHDGPARKVRLYVDGQLVDERDFVSPWHANGDFQIGRARSAGKLVEYWPGDIDDAHVYTGVLTDREILQLMLSIG